MPIANTVEATIVVNFEDRFTGPACKAFENFRKCAEAALKAMNQPWRTSGTNLNQNRSQII